MKRPIFILAAAAAAGLCYSTYFQTVKAQDALSGDGVGPATVMTRTLPAPATGEDRTVSVEQQGADVIQLPPSNPTTGLIINPTFDATVTSNANSAAIQSMVNQAVTILQAQFSDRITVSILFRFSTTGPTGQPVGGLAQSMFPIYPIAWNNYRQSLVTDARTANDATAIASLPAAPPTNNIILSSANGRSLGLNTPGTLNSNGSNGGTFDGIVTLNSSQSFSFVRPPGGRYDALRAAQHEIDEILGLGSYINSGLNDYEPQDLFSWSGPGIRNATAGGTRFFSINGGISNIVGFNQMGGGDYGDWLSSNCPQTNNYVQNAFSCPGQIADVTATSPEGINLDIIGYNPGNAPAQFTFDYDGDVRSDISVFRPSSGSWYLLRSRAGTTGLNFGLSSDKIVPADFDGDGKTDIAVYRPSTGVWFIIDSSTQALEYRVFGIGEDLPVAADYDGDGRADIAVFRPSSGTWYRQNSSNGMFTAVQFGATTDKPTVGDFDGDGKADIAVFRPSNGVWYHVNSSNGAFSGEQFGISSDITVPGDYDGDGKTDVAVYRASNGFWYIKKSSNSMFVATQFGISTDIPAPGDFDGDGKTDLSVFRPTNGVWYRLDSSNGMFNSAQFGANGDRPTQSAFTY